MRKGAVLLLMALAAVEVMGQTSLLGGANINVNTDKPLTSIRYFGGVEFKVRLSRVVKIYFSPQYNGLTNENHIADAAMMPVGISIQVNEMWDERTSLLRLIDLNVGVYGGYIFNVEQNNSEATKTYSPIDYGVKASTKLRLFIFMPLYISYSYSLSELYRFDDKNIFKHGSLQVGVYVPVSHFFKYY